MLTVREEALRHAETQLVHWQGQLRDAREPGKARAAQFWVDYYQKQVQQERATLGRAVFHPRTAPPTTDGSV